MIPTDIARRIDKKQIVSEVGLKLLFFLINFKFLINFS